MDTEQQVYVFIWHMYIYECPDKYDNEWLVI